MFFFSVRDSFFFQTHFLVKSYLRVALRWALSWAVTSATEGIEGRQLTLGCIGGHRRAWIYTQWQHPPKSAKMVLSFEFFFSRLFFLFICKAATPWKLPRRQERIRVVRSSSLSRRGPGTNRTALLQWTLEPIMIVCDEMYACVVRHTLGFETLFFRSFVTRKGYCVTISRKCRGFWVTISRNSGDLVWTSRHSNARGLFENKRNLMTNLQKGNTPVMVLSFMFSFWGGEYSTLG